MYLNTRRNGDNLEVELAGSWRGTDLPAIDAELAAQSIRGVRALRITVPESAGARSGGCLAPARMDEGGGEPRARAWSSRVPMPGQLELIESTLAGKCTLTPPFVVGAELRARERARPACHPPLQALKTALDFLGRATTLPGARLHQLAAAAPDLDRAARLRNRPHRHSHRFADRVPDHGDHCLHRRAVHARIWRRDLRGRPHHHQRAARARRCCSPPSSLPAARAALSRPRSAR